MSDPLSRIEQAFDHVCDGLARWARGAKPKPTEAKHLWEIASQGRSEVRAMRGGPTRDPISATRRRQVLDRAHGQCETPGCRAPAEHVDHIVPVARFGASTDDNLQALCRACNLRKGVA